MIGEAFIQIIITANISITAVWKLRCTIAEIDIACKNNSVNKFILSSLY